MADDILKNPHLRSGYTGDEEPSFPKAGPAISKAAPGGDQNRGKHAPRSGSGAVAGSGAGAGGGGGDEDFDSDPMGGGGAAPAVEDDRPKSGADAPVGGSR